jgi:hypothetical protein
MLASVRRLTLEWLVSRIVAVEGAALLAGAFLIGAGPEIAG